MIPVEHAARKISSVEARAAASVTLRQATVTVVNAGPPPTVAVDFGNGAVTQLRLADTYTNPVVGDSVWVDDIGKGRMIVRGALATRVPTAAVGAYSTAPVAAPCAAFTTSGTAESTLCTILCPVQPWPYILTVAGTALFAKTQGDEFEMRLKQAATVLSVIRTANSTATGSLIHPSYEFAVADGAAVTLTVVVVRIAGSGDLTTFPNPGWSWFRWRAARL